MLIMGLTIGIAAVSVTGCALQHEAAEDGPPPAPLVVVVSPVLNLSNSSEWDPLKVTDIVASELQTFPNVVVIPVNRVLSALALSGKQAVETPQDALDLAREFDADATIVTAITEYEPYYPPRVGIIMQWYSTGRAGDMPVFDPVSASRQASEIAPAAATASGAARPQFQAQRVYDAAHDALQREIRSYGNRREGGHSADGWRVHLKSQELFVRYCCWATIRSMLLERERIRIAPSGNEAKRWTDKDDV